MTKKTRYQTYLLSGLLVVLALALFYTFRSHDDVFMGVQADEYGGKFEPLNVPDPSLRLDLLERIQKEGYKGQRRNIFSAEPLPPPVDVLAARRAEQQGPVVPPPPPPVTVPATFYGIVTDPAMGNRRACFSTNDGNIYIVAEGSTLLNQFRVVKIGNNTVEVEELSSGRTTTLTLPEGAAPANLPPQEARP
jgi:hypothetical protein